MKKILTMITVVMFVLCGCEKKETEDIRPDVTDVKDKIESVKEEKFVTHIEHDKEETVYVTADAYGNPEKTEVEVILKSGDSKTIEDISNLYDIRNTGSDETFTNDDMNLVFENKGEDIHYKGLSDLPLPVNVRLSYYLDGRTVSAEELKGATGRVRIRFDYTNTTSVSQDGYTLIQPFLALSVVVLDSEKSTNIKVENGKLLEFDGNRIALIAALPGIRDSLKLSSYELTKDLGLKDYGEIEFDACDFSLEYTATILSNDLFSELKDDDLDDLYDFADQTKDFKKDSEELTDSTAKMLDACITLQEGLNAYTGAINILDTSMDTITEGAAQLAAGLEQISEMFEAEEDKKTAIEEIIELLKSLMEQTEEYEKALEQLETDIQELEGYAESIADPEKKAEFTAKTEDCKTQLEKLKEMKVNDLLTAVDVIVTKISLLQESLQQLSAGSSQLSDGLAKIKEGTSALSENGCQINLGVKQLVKAAREFDDGMNDFVNDDLDDLMKLGGSSLSEIADRIKAMKKVDSSYGCFSGLKEGRSGKTVFIIETAAIKQ